jgi:nucleotide-binding universal stress UspA family protein
MFGKILLAAGGQEASEPARVAGRLCRELGARLTIISVYPHTIELLGEPTYGETLNKRLEEADDALAAASRVASAEGAGQPDTDKLEGDPVERIVKVAHDGDFELIVMGTRRRGRIEAALLGSVSAGVAARAGVPVLIVPEHKTSQHVVG